MQKSALLFLLIFSLVPALSSASTLAPQSEAQRIESMKRQIGVELRSNIARCNSLASEKERIKCQQNARIKYNKSMQNIQKDVLRKHKPNMQPYRDQYRRFFNS